MGKGALLRWAENKRMARYLRGRGVEIGALWRKFPVPSQARVWYVDRDQPRDLHEDYPEVEQELVVPEVVADAADLPFGDGSLDFIIASHVMEHMPFPLAVMRHWYRILAPGGVLLLKIPDKRYTFDIKRQRTPLQHLIAEDMDAASFDKRAHFRDWLEKVMGLPSGSEQCEQEVDRLMGIDYSIHYHVWTEEDVRALIEYSRVDMKLNWRPVIFFGARFYRKECAVVLRKG